MSEQKPEAASEGIVGQSAPTAGLCGTITLSAPCVTVECGICGWSKERLYAEDAVMVLTAHIERHN